MEALLALALALVAFLVIKAILPTLVRLVRALLGMAIVACGYVAAVWLLRTAASDGVEGTVYGAVLFGLAGIVVGHLTGRWVGGWRTTARSRVTGALDGTEVMSVHHPESPTIHHPPVAAPGPRFCSHCGNYGKVTCYGMHYPGSPPCGLCNGSGWITCPACHGL
jgi:hypothetical protein